MAVLVSVRMKRNCDMTDQELIRERISHLKEWRRKEGVTQSIFSQRSGVSVTQLARYETGKTLPCERNYNRIAEVCGWPQVKEKKPSPSLKQSRPKKILLTAKSEYEFEAGKIYRIYSRGASGGKCKTESWERTCEYRYEGRDGIHHKFREIRGNWTRTYTDAQLIGKRIEEVTR